LRPVSIELEIGNAALPAESYQFRMNPMQPGSGAERGILSDASPAFDPSCGNRRPEGRRRSGERRSGAENKRAIQMVLST
jgi:hypothetical protein